MFVRIQLVFGIFLMNTAIAPAAELQEVASFPDKQITGVGVSTTSGRIFVNFPYWSDDHSISVAEIVNGQPKAFPNDEWNKAGPAGLHFICVQSVVVDDLDTLWVLDPAAPKMQEIVKGGPKLVKIDLATNQVVQTIPFGEDVAPKKSYLNDVRIDTRMNTAFITESGRGAIIIADKRLLWPDTLSWGPKGEMYVTASQIENMPRFNNGKSTRTEPYKLWKIIGIGRK